MESADAIDAGNLSQPSAYHISQVEDSDTQSIYDDVSDLYNKEGHISPGATSKDGRSQTDSTTL